MKAKRQIELLHKMKRLAEAGVFRDGIVSQIAKYGNKLEKQAAESCKQSLGGGLTVAHGLKDYLSKNAYLSLLSNEQSGEFKLGLNDAIGSLQIENASTVQLISVFRKPILTLIGLFFASAMISKYAFPALADLVDKRKWGAISVIANDIGLFWLNNGLLIGGLLTFTIISMFISLPLWVGESRKYVDNLPVYKHYRYIQCTNLLTAIAHQTSIGTAIKQALQQYSQESGKYVTYHIERMIEIMGTGRTNLGDLLDTGLLVDEEVDTLKLLGDVGDFSDILKRSASIHQDRLIDEINSLKNWGVKITNVIAYSFGGIIFLGLMLLAFDSITQNRMGF